MKNRLERISDAEFRLSGIKLVLEPLQKQLDSVQSELNRAKSSYDLDEHVKVTETCRRGCCVELEYTGTVIEENSNGSYKIKRDGDGHVFECASTYDMKRL